MRLKADIALIFTSLVWGSAFAFQRIAGEQGVVYLFNGVRFFLGAVVLIPFAGISLRNRKKQDAIASEQWLWMGVAGAVLFTASTFQQIGLQYTTSGNASFITSLYVVFVPFILFAFWREAPRWQALFAVCLAAGGAFLISAGGDVDIQRGDGFELLGALFWGFYFVVLGKFANRYDAILFSIGHFAISAGLNLIVGLLFERTAIVSPPALVGAILYTGIISVGVGYTLQVWGQKYTPPTEAALILSLEAVFGALFGWLILQETMSPSQIVGCILIFLGVILTQNRSL